MAENPSHPPDPALSCSAERLIRSAAPATRTMEAASRREEPAKGAGAPSAPRAAGEAFRVRPLSYSKTPEMSIQSPDES